jgi:hypothetical protein
MAEESRGYERLVETVRELMKKAKTVEGGLALGRIDDNAKLAVEIAKLCELTPVLTRFKEIGKNMSFWFESEKPSSEDLMKLETAISFVKEDIAKILQEKCGCRWK